MDKPRTRTTEMPPGIDRDLAERARRSRVKLAHRCDRRRASLELEQLAPRPKPTPRPCTFGLNERELRAEARRLHATGWSIDDITAVLAVEPDIRTAAR
jgi:hypothetical protein